MAIRLSPRLAARSFPIGRGITLRFEAITPAAVQASAACAVAAFPPDATQAQKNDVSVRTFLDHFCVEVEDDAGDVHPYTPEVWREIEAADPRLYWPMRDAVNAILSDGQEAIAEGEESPPSSDGATGAA